MKIVRVLFFTLLAIISTAMIAQSPLINGIPNQSVYGYTAPNNVLQYACGIPINDGNFHPVNTAGNCFSGVTTLAGLAAITVNGTHPFSFVTDSGTITGPLCTFGTTTNCFTSGGGTYALTNTMVTNGTIDVGWLAMQACFLARDCQITGGSIQFNLTAMAPISIQNSTGINISGAGPQVTILIPHRDFGTGVPAISCGDPSGTSSNNLGRYAAGNGQCAGNLNEIAIKWTGTAPVIGTSGVNMDGLAWGSRLNMQNVEIDNFNHGRTVVGDHAKFYNLHEFGNYIGDYFITPNSVLIGNIQYYGLDNESVFASFSVVPGTSISAGWDQSTYIASPFNFYGEAATGGGCTPILNGAQFDGLQTEFTSIAFLQDASVLPGQLSNGSSYNDAAACRGAVNTSTRGWFFSFQYTNDTAIHAAFPNYVRRAAIDAYNADQFTHTGFNSNGGNVNPNGGTIGAAKAFFYLQAVGNVTGTGIHFSGDVDAFISSLGAVPVFYLPTGGAVETFSIEQPGVWSGYMANMSSFNPASSYTQTTAGDVLEYYAQQGFWAAPGGLSNNGPYTPVLGVAKQSGIPSGQDTFYVPIATSGFAPVNMGFSSYPSGGNSIIKTSTGIGKLIIVAGTGGTTGTYNWTSNGGGCTTPANGTITVAGGIISSYVILNKGNHCTGTPSVPLPSGTGLTGASLTAVWPSAQGENATDPSDAPTFGILLEGISGSSATGNLIDLVRLQPTNGSPGVVTSVANSDSTLTVSPTTGSIIASLNLAHANTWSAVQTMASPSLTGIPLATTAAVNTNTTQIATTAFVLNQAGTTTPLINGSAAVGTSLLYARQDHIHPTDTTRAALASPTFTGTPAAPTASTGTNTTQLATTAFVQAQILSSTLGGTLSNGNAAVGAGAGTGGTASLTGLDGTHLLTIVAGTLPTLSATIVTVTFTATRGHISYCTLSPSNSAAALLSGANMVFMGSNSATSYAITSGTTALSASLTYTWNITCP